MLEAIPGPVRVAANAASRITTDTAYPWDDPATIERVSAALRNKYLATMYDHPIHWDAMAKAAIEAVYSHEA